MLFICSIINKKSGSVSPTFKGFQTRVQAFVFLQETLQWTLEAFAGFLNCELLNVSASHLTRQVT
jgi:hypothetical protein